MREDLQQLLAQIGNTKALKAALVRFAVEDAESTNRDWGMFLRACAIPRTLTADVIDFLQRILELKLQPVTDKLREYPFFTSLANNATGFSMHDDARATLLDDWRLSSNRLSYEHISRQLAGYYEKRSDPLEALYHRFVFDSQSAFREFERQFSEADRFYQRNRAEALFNVVHAQAVEITDSQRAWLSYYQAHLYLLLDRWLDAERTLSGLDIQSLPVELLPWMLYDRGRALEKQGKWESAVIEYDKARQDWEAAGNEYGQARVLNSIGPLYRRLGKWTDGLDAYNKALEIFEKLGMRLDVAKTLGNQGLAHFEQGSWDAALFSFEKALEVFRELDDRHDEAWVLSNLGTLYSAQGQTEKAISATEQALAVFQATNDSHSQAGAQANLGAAYGEQGNIIRSLESYQRSLEIFESLGEQYEVAQTLQGQGDSLVKQGQWVLARDAYARALNIFHSLSDRYKYAIVLGRIGALAVRQGQWTDGMPKLEQCLHEIKAFKASHDEAFALAWIGRCYAGQAQWELAVQNLLQALSSLLSQNSPLSFQIYMTLAEVSFAMNKPGQINSYLRKALEAF